MFYTSTPMQYTETFIPAKIDKNDIFFFFFFFFAQNFDCSSDGTQKRYVLEQQ